MLPAASMWKTVVVAVSVDELTVKRGVCKLAATPATESLAQGVVVAPMPTFSLEARKRVEVPETECCRT